MNDGGPAFPEAPVSMGSLSTRMRPGMTLRDYFAAKAMQADLMNPNHALNGWPLRQTVAESAYLYADAMLAEREKMTTSQKVGE